MAGMKIRCPNCAASMNRSGVPAGGSLLCPHCHAVFHLPKDTTQEAGPEQEFTAADPAVFADVDNTHVSVTVRTDRFGTVSDPGTSVSTTRTLDPDATLPPPADDDLAHNDMLHGPGIERYVIDEEIGRGGMGLILRCFDQDIRRHIAMKILRREKDARNRQRFLEEAQVTGQLEHPSIVPVHELGIDHLNRPFFTMKLVKGHSIEDILHDLSKRRSLLHRDWPLGRLMGALMQVCHAIEFAHASGVIHRDLKPANIMAGDFGEVLVMDWGLARVGVQTRASLQTSGSTRRSRANQSAAIDLGESRAEEPAHQSGPETVPRHPDGKRTAHGSVIGTPMYMSPEQARGDIAATDERSDVYSLGAILYEILTLIPPITGSSSKDVLRQVREGRIRSPQSIAPQRDIPRELSAIAMKALSKRPDARYQTVAEMREDLQRYIDGRTVMAKDATLVESTFKLLKRNSQATITGLIAAGILLVLGGWFLGSLTAVQEEIEVHVQDNVVRGEQLKEALAELQAAEQRRHQERARDVPAFLAAARSALANGAFANSRTYLNLILEYAPNNAEAHLLDGLDQLVRRDYAAAYDRFATASALGPVDPEYRSLMQLSFLMNKRPRPEHDQKLAEVLQQLPFPAVAQEMRTGHYRRFLDIRERLAEVWPRAECTLSQISPATWRLEVDGPFADLTPLRGLPIVDLTIRDGSEISDLKPIVSLPLESIALHHCHRIARLDRALPRTLTKLTLIDAPAMGHLDDLQRLRLQELHVEDLPRLKDISGIRELPLQRLVIDRCPAIASFEPIKRLPLRHLVLSDCPQFTRTELLQRLPLQKLWLPGTGISNLGFLADLPAISDLDISRCTSVSDFSRTGQLPLKRFAIAGMPHLSDLEWLRSPQLEELIISDTPQLTSLSPLADLPLRVLDCSQCPNLHDIAPLRGAPLENLDITRTPISNLMVLEGDLLRSIGMDTGQAITFGDMIRNLPQLTTVRLTRQSGEVEALSPQAIRDWLGRQKH